jgi:mannose-1-phosphate guanylyltransferase
LAVAVLTADHMIGAPDRFRATMQAALDLACAEDVLVTIGVPPARPETGYGYIEVAEPIRPTDGVPPGRPVVCFREKPDLETARSYVASGRHLWNSGMFFWRVSTFLAGLEAHMPQLAAGYRDMLRAFEAKPGAPALAEVFGSLTDVSIDYGLMEKAKNVRVIPATFPWDDVGAWDALARSRARDAHGNVAPEEAILLDARDCIVHREGDGKERAIAVIGLSDVIVATTDDAVLVCHRDRAQDVRAVVAELKRRGRGHLT